MPARTGEDGEGIGYAFQMYLDNTSGATSETWSDKVGSKAWSDPSNPLGPLGIPMGWTHTSAWAYISLYSDADVVVTLTGNASDLVPAKSLWLGSNSGIDLSQWTINYVADMSADGAVVVGYGINPDGNTEAWLADLNAAPVAVAGGILAYGNGLTSVNRLTS
ncbi:MAG: hypothetical protein ACU836_01030 [Gammaproteobacteria bacterium]